MIDYPGFDPVALELGPLKVRWYGITYLIAFAAAWWLGRRRAAQAGSTWKPIDVDDFVFFCMLGVILGGRLGYTLFYGFDQWMQDPLYLLRIWEGGMSFHGGLLGAVIAVWLFSRRHKVSMLSVSDLTCAFAPITIFLVRIANFVNDELWGRVTDVPWAMVFPRGGPLPRHPSQLYEAALEGLVLLVIVQVALRVFRAHQKPGLISAIFLAGYGLFRFICEFFREPDTQFIGPISMGMALSIPIWIGAGLLLWIVSKRPRAA